MAHKDNIYSQQLDQVKDFVFDSKVVSVFDDMIKRSVPGYGAIITMIGCLAEEFVQDNTHIYDLGCSLGAGTLAIAQKLPYKNCKIIAVDNSSEMVQQAQHNIDQAHMSGNIDVQCANVQDVNINNASMVVMNFTLQFIPVDERAHMIQRIYDGLNSGGIFVLSEKIAFDEKQEQDFQTKMHHTFKKLNGYSDLEISQKRSALENVLIPESLAKHQQSLKDSGFAHIYPWFQCFNFLSLVAIKS